MSYEPLVAMFVNEAEAERAMTQLRAAGVPDGSMTLANDGPEGTRADEVGVPDSAAGTGPDDAAQIRLVIELAGLDVEPDEIDRILAAAGGRQS